VGSANVGAGVNGSWTVTPRGVDSMIVLGDKLCAGLGGYGGRADVWCWSGSGNWIMIGGGPGAGVNNSWPLSSNVSAMSIYDNKLYVAVTQANTYITTVWSWDGTSWLKVGGTDVNSSWSDGAYNAGRTFAVYNGNLYFGAGSSANGNPTGDVWRWNGATWTQVGGDGIGNSWATIDNRETVSSLTVYKGKLYAGLGLSTNLDALVYSFGDNAYIESSTSSFSSNWTHIGATYDGLTMKLYINGVQDTSNASSVTGIDNALPLRIGASYGSNISGSDAGYFNGQLDEVRISNIARSSFNAKPYPDTKQSITLSSSVNKVGVLAWDGFSVSESPNGGSINYRLSDDSGSTWKFWNGSSWANSASLSDASNKNDINAHIASFPVTFNGIKWQAILNGDGSQQVGLSNVSIGYNQDGAAPSQNASAIVANKSIGGSVISPGGWANGSSPYFSWNTGLDSGSGIGGYCLYLGDTASADPVTTKGLLGSSPSNSGGNCQFMVADTHIDLATSGNLGTPLTTSNSNYYLNIKAIDKAGNVFPSSEQFSFRFDNTPPSNPDYVSAPASFVNNKNITITWPTSGNGSPQDANSGIAGLQYKINNTSWYGSNHNGSGDMSDLLPNNGSYTTQNTPDFSNINDGVNTIYFRTWDQAGNISTSSITAALKINTSGAPSEPQNVTATPSVNTTNSFSFSWSAPNTFVGNQNGLSYCYTINIVPSATSCTFTANGVNSLPASAFATQPGVNTFYVVARDESSNINYSSYGSTQFTANTPAPGIPVNIDVADVSVKATSNWRLAVTWDPPSSVGAGVSNYRVLRSSDNNNFSQIGSSSSTSYVDTGLSQQKYYYKVKACDSANNCGAETGVVSYKPTGKFTSPATITSQPIVSNITTRKATVAWATDRTSDSKITIGTQSGTYGSSEVGNSAQTTSHEINLDNLSAGTTYYAKALWTDEDGNTGSSQEFVFTTSPAPQLKEVTTQSVSLSSAIINFTSKQSSKVNIYYGKSDAFGAVKSINTSTAESNYSFSLSGLDDGTKYFYKLSTFDQEGTEYGGNIFSFTTPPRPHINDLRFQPVEGEPTSTQKVTWVTNVPSTTQVSYGKVNATAVDIVQNEPKITHEVVIRNLEDSSEYYLIAQSRDQGGNLAVSDQQRFKTALDTRPPKISDITIEVSIKGTGAEARGQVVVAWKTDEPASSQVAYAEGNNATVFNNKTAVDDALSTDHLVIVSDLPTSKLYSVKPVSKDRSGNQGEGEVQPAIVGKASDSVLTIILNTLQNIFGF